MPPQENPTQETETWTNVFLPESLLETLDDADLVGNVQRIKVLCKTHVGLLHAIGAHKSVDLSARDVVHLLDSLGDLALVCPHVRDEHECVVVFDLLHGRLGCERVPAEYATSCQQYQNTKHHTTARTILRQCTL